MSAADDYAEGLAARLAREIPHAEAVRAGREGEDYWETANALTDRLLADEICEDVSAADLSDIARDALYAELQRRGIAID